MSIICVKVKKKYAEAVRKLLLRHGLINKEYKVFCKGDYVFIPIVSRDKVAYLLKKQSLYETCLVECTPPKKERLTSSWNINIPSYDLVGDVIIIRRKAIEMVKDINALIDLLTKIHPRVKAIYVKEHTDEVYRISRLKLLWGQEVDEVVSREYGLAFHIKLKEVYYNPRLSTEHRRIAEMVSDNEKVFDLFSGVGCFAIHIAYLHNTLVYANDINPSAVSCILKNIYVNRRKLKGKIIVSLSDAADMYLFVKRGVADRIIANLPHRSIDFFNVYNYLAHKDTFLHLYVLSDEKSIEDKLKFIELSKWVVEDVTLVLDYAPHKYIYRVDAVKR